MQQTTFPFVAMVVDDASTDGEQDVIAAYVEEHFDTQDSDIAYKKETDYAHITFARHKTNKNCYIVVLYLKENHYSKKLSYKKLEYLSEWRDTTKYEAFCEGDDYWIDPLKLQKQVEYFKLHKNCGLVYTGFQQRNDVLKTSRIIVTDPKVKHDDTFKWKLLEQKIMVGTCTTMIERELTNEISKIKDDFEGYKMGDTQLWFNASRIKGIGYIPEVTAVYRKQPLGVTSFFEQKSRNIFLKSCLDLDLHLAYKYKAPKETINNIKIQFGSALIHNYINLHEYESALFLNKDIFNDNRIVKFYILLAQTFNIKNSRGLFRILVLLNKLGLLK